MAETASDRITGFMQAWDRGHVVATSVSHGHGRQELRWDDLAEALDALRPDRAPMAGVIPLLALRRATEAITAEQERTPTPDPDRLAYLALEAALGQGLTEPS